VKKIPAAAATFNITQTLSIGSPGTEPEFRQEICGTPKAYALNVSGAIGSRVTGGVGAGAGSLARAFAAGAPCLLLFDVTATTEKAGSSRNTTASTVSFFMGGPCLEDDLE